MKSSLGCIKNQNGASPVGFAGLSEMVTDVSTVIAAAESPHQSRRQNAGWPETRLRHTVNNAARKNAILRLFGWSALIATIVCSGVAYLMGEYAQSPSQSRGKPAVPVNVEVRLEMPEVGGLERTLGVSQIRYCAAQTIRLEGARKVVDHSLRADIDNFNALIADWNSRCGEFHYLGKAMQTASSEIEAHRDFLESEGRAWFEKTSSKNARHAKKRPPAAGRGVDFSDLPLEKK